MELGYSRYDHTNGILSFARDLREMVMNVLYHPSRYVKAIRQMMDIYDLQRKGTTTSTNYEIIPLVINNFLSSSPILSKPN